MKIVATKYQSSIRNEKNIHLFFGKKELLKFNQMEPKLKSNWLCGRIALKQAFLVNYSLPIKYASEITVENLPNGQPYIPKYNKIFCSISHSSKCGIGAISNFPIGLDMERVKPRKRNLIEFISDITEVNFFRSKYKSSNDLITALWTIKESVLKGLGEGFNYSPKTIRIRNIEKNISTIEILNRINPIFWKVATYKKEGYFISIAYPESIDYNKRYEEIEISWFDPSLL